MKIFNLQYTNKENTGMATVEAKSAKSATVVLQSFGRLNANQYKVNSITEIGCNNHSEEKLIAESFGVEELQSNENVKFDINSLTDKDIENLKLRINKYTGTLYVDRIGSGFRTHSRDGHTVFYTKGSNRYVNVEKYQEGCVYVKKDDEYINIGIPFKYKFIESPKKKIKVDYYTSTVDSKIKEIKNITVIEQFYKRLGVFYRINSRGSNKRSSDKVNTENKRRPAKWRFIAELNEIVHHAGFTRQNLNINENILQFAILKYYPELFDSCRVRRKFSFTPKNKPTEKTVYQQRIAVGEMHKIKGFKRKTFFRLKGIPLLEFTVSRVR